ncbi:unnamed protein product [Natator depressus]
MNYPEQRIRVGRSTLHVVGFLPMPHGCSCEGDSADGRNTEQDWAVASLGGPAPGSTWPQPASVGWVRSSRTRPVMELVTHVGNCSPTPAAASGVERIIMKA